jgi:hypothetical protein
MQAPPGLEKEPQLMTSRARRNETRLGQCDVSVQSKWQCVIVQSPQMFLVELHNPSAETFPHRSQCPLVELDN